MALANYFTEWRTKSYTCPCGWSGIGTELDTEPFDALLQASCPKCDHHLVLISYPFEDEVRAAAAAGHEEAKSMLVGVEATKERRARRDPLMLSAATQLPDVVGRKLRFEMDIEGPTLEAFYVITLGDLVVWREPARYEDWERFEEVKAMFKERYGSRFASLTPTDGAYSNLIGDNMRMTITPT